MKKDAKIYVAGHQGMVGSAIMRRLGWEGYANVHTRIRQDLDLIDQGATEAFFDRVRPEVVFLAAARVGGIWANMTRMSDFLYENLQVQNNVIRAAQRYGVKTFVFLGSSCIYPRDCPQPMKEDSFLTGPFEPTNEGYAIAKIAGMKLCSYIADSGGWDCLNVVPCNLYGPGDNFSPEDSHVFAALTKRFVDAKNAGEKRVICWGTGTPRREFLHVDDLVECVFMLLRGNPYGSQPVNIGYGSDVSIRELAEGIARACAYEGEIVWDTSKPDGMMRKLMDTERARAIGFVPGMDLERGIACMIEEYRNYRDGCTRERGYADGR